MLRNCVVRSEKLRKRTITQTLLNTINSRVVYIYTHIPSAIYKTCIIIIIVIFAQKHSKTRVIRQEKTPGRTWQTDTALSAESLVNANYSNLACRPIHSRFDLASAQKEMFFYL